MREGATRVNRRFDLLALDVDGTLIGAGHGISPRLLDALSQTTHRGMRICLCTGRPLAATKPFADMFDPSTPPVTFNGALIPGLDGGQEPFLCHPLPRSSINALARGAREMEAYLELHTAAQYHVESLNYAGEGQAAKLGLSPVIGPFDGFWRQQAILKAQFVLRTEQQRSQLEALGLRLRSQVALSWAVSPGFDGDFVNVMRVGVDKASSLDALLGALCIPWGRVFAAGDSPSDLAYVRRAGHGVIMGNAPQATRDRAPRVAASVEEDGLARAIEQVVFCRAGDRPPSRRSAEQVGKTPGPSSL